MIRVTTAESVLLPATLTGADAPLWRDSHGNLYRVASALQETCPPQAWAPDPDDLTPPPQATVNATVQIVAIDGRSALTLMGLWPGY
ncbi:hypothetical protein [Roseinatronobacter sp. S2]|uniref:hypothetical protein n=1 Tax=Roseinatronobacter sp. S2 TaxID=3035471 RepID=UPI00240F06A8|nr:hypothetical protein [Roseinatronobacter sp. S2]WFE75339.1 hypothetical protein P8S53_02750 [Roseinatronobacter sp. S2]